MFSYRLLNYFFLTTVASLSNVYNVDKLVIIQSYISYTLLNVLVDLLLRFNRVLSFVTGLSRSIDGNRLFFRVTLGADYHLQSTLDA